MSDSEQQMNSSDAAAGKGLEVLLQVAGPDLYRQNAFRVAELPVDATARDLARRQQMVEMAHEAGLPVPPGPGRALPLEDGGNSSALAEAMQRLRDPEQRLVDEFFWFWPHILRHSHDDPALAALARGDARAASDLWLELERSASEANVSMHNLAVLAHVTALDLECAARTRPLSEREQRQRDAAWSQAYRRWRGLIDYEGFWSRLTARIRDLDDPRLPTGTARRLQATLPLALLSINAQLAAAAAQRGDAADAKRQLQTMEQSGLERSAIDEALRRTVEPLRGRLKTICKSSDAEGDADPPHANQAARRVMEQARPILAVADSLLPAGHPVRDGMHDEVALTALSCQITYGARTDDWKDSLALLEMALPIAAGGAARARIEENIAIVKRNLQASTCWFCGQARADDAAAVEVKMYGEVTRTPTFVNGSFGTRLQWRQGTIKVPRCAGCKALHQRSSNTMAVALGIVGAIVGAVLSLATAQVVCVIGGLFIGACIGAAAGENIDKNRFKLPQGVKAQTDVDGYPAIADLKKKGWQLGEKPTA